MITIASDFSGVGALEHALQRLKIAHKNVFSCEMDKYARKTFIANNGTKEDVALLDHKDVKFCDDIYYRAYISKSKTNKKPTFSEIKKLLTIQEATAKLFSFYYPWNVKYRKIPKKSVDIYVATPPCQTFSIAGKRKGENDDRGILFYNSHKFIQKNQPNYFIFENVKGLLSDDKTDKAAKYGKTFTKWITLLGGKTVNGLPVIFPHNNAVPYHIYYKVLNAKHHNVPQNRERIFIIGIKADANNTFSWPNETPLKLKLKDVLETNVDKKFYLSDEAIERLCNNNTGFKSEPKDENDIASTICASDYKITRGMNVLKIKSATKKGFEIAEKYDGINLSNLSSKKRRGRVGKAVCQTLDTACNQAVVIAAIRGRNPENSKSRQKGLPTKQMLEFNLFETDNTLTTVQKDNVVVTKNYLQLDTSGKNHKSQQDRVYFGDVINTISADNRGDKHKIITEQTRIRKLTPRECFRLMNFSDTFIIDQVSNTQAYKQAGNSVVVKMFELLIFNLLKQK
jgi:DNA (cytosine-5)-methyltransferase 1